MTPDQFNPNPEDGSDFYFTVFDRDMTGHLFGSYFGGNGSTEHVDGGTSRFDDNGVIYQAVCADCGTGGSLFPSTTGAYAENNGQLLPGYQPKVGFLGRDQIGGSLAPSLGFVFGSQIDIRNRALTNGWLVDPRLEGDDYYDKTFSKTHYNKLDYKH